MGWLTSTITIASLTMFIMYNMDQINRLSLDVKYVKSRIDELLVPPPPPPVPTAAAAPSASPTPATPATPAA